MAKEKLDFENAHFLLSLLAGDISLVKEIESMLDVRVTTRDSWIDFEGEDAAVARAVSAIHDLEVARRNGSQISRQAFVFAIEGAAAGEQGAVTELLGYQLLGDRKLPPVIPRTRNQLAYLKSIEGNDVVFGVGPAGTGKTYLAVAAALSALKQKKVKRLVLTRPAVEAGEVLGFLPGDLTEKILPYLRPLYDALYDMVDPDEVNKMIELGQIEIAPLAYMRGRTLNNAAIILDEAQNTTSEQMFMFLTRLGEESRCTITGDPSQVDLKGGVISGLSEAMEILSPCIEGIDFIEFERRDVVRHHVVASIIKAYDESRERKSS
ncbi:MAG: PhoH family protein [Verrucomicrobiaceae bacterium]|nr:PhoH family protein [Verrucomicrobiaceae bacterium]